MIVLTGLGKVWPNQDVDRLGSNPGMNKPASVLDKAHISQDSLAQVTAETVWVPAVVHSFDHTADDELTWGEQEKEMGKKRNGIGRWSRSERDGGGGRWRMGRKCR